MLNRLAAVAAAALVTALVSAPPAGAATTAPTPLTVKSVSLKVSVDAPSAGEPVECDGNNYVFCGFLSLNVVLAGLDGRERPAPEDYFSLTTEGSVDLTRVYGCASAQGKRLHRYDTKVVQQNYRIINRRNIPFPVPAGDTVDAPAFGLLEDAQPGNCPKGTTPRLYRLTAKNVRLTLESRWAGIPASTTYTLPNRACWKGSARTPQL